MTAQFATAHFGVFSEGLAPGRFVSVSRAGGRFGFKGVDVHWPADGAPQPMVHRRLAVIGWDSRSAAEEFLEQQLASPTAFAGAQVAYNLLLQPYRQHGAINWIDAARPGPIFHLGDDRVAPDGHVCVMTSFGAPKDRESFDTFAARMREVMPRVEAAPGCRFATQMRPADMSVDGVTFTAWQTERQMTDWAYGARQHREALQVQRQRPMASRTSFTRFRVLREEILGSQGTQSV